MNVVQDKILIFAGNYVQALNFAESQKALPHRWQYINSIHQLQGQRKRTIMFVGTFQWHPQYEMVNRYAMAAEFDRQYEHRGKMISGTGAPL